MSPKPKVSQKLRAQILDALNDAYLEVLSANAPRTLEEHPDRWEPEETRTFDMLTHLEFEAGKRIKALLS